jgi:outer membrane protein assembly factor BamD
VTRRAIAVVLCGLLAAVLAAALVGCGATTLPAVHSEAERMATARRMIERKNWVSAQELLKGYIKNNPGSADIDQAVYLLGLCYLNNHDYVQATTEFDRMTHDYPESDSTPSASYRLGEAYFAQARPPDFDQDFTHKAIDQWTGYLRDYPGHWLNPAAEQQLNKAKSRLATKLVETGELYLRLGYPTPARTYFQRVEQEYSETTLIPRVELGIARCDAKERLYPEAIARYKQIEERFPRTHEAYFAGRERKKLEKRHHP